MDERSKNVAMYAAAGALAGFAAWQFLSGRKMPRLRGQVVVITGGSRGLGLQLARDFAAQGCRLALCARTGEDLDIARSELESATAEVLAMECDVRSRSEVERFLGSVIARFGQIDILVNNAGVIQVGPVESMRLEDFENAMDIMFWGVLYPTWTALPHMLERGRGRIVNITSIGGKVPLPHMVPYSCAKFAAVALSEGLRTELGPKGVQVLTVVPGLMRTGSFLNALFKGHQDKEFEWFGLSGNMPGMSMDVNRASSQIIRAVREGSTETVLSAPAQVLSRLHGAFPELTTALMGVVNQYILPRAEGGSTDTISGAEADRSLDSPLFRFLTVLGRMAADRMNQRPQHA